MLRSCSPNRDAKHVSGQCDVRSVMRSTMTCHPARLHTSEIRPIASKLNSPRATCYSHQGGREVHVRSRESPAGHNIASDPNALASENSRLLEDNERLRGRIRHLESMLRETMTKCRGMAEGDASADTIDGTVMQRIPPEDPTFVRIDMLKMLGPHSYHYGISYDPMVCFPPLNESFPSASVAELTAVFERGKMDLAKEMARIHDVEVSAVDVSREYLAQTFSKGISDRPFYDSLHELSADAKYLEWRRSITRVLGRYLCSADGRIYMNKDHGCPGPDQPKISQLGTSCPDISLEEANKAMGVYTAPWESINDIVTFSLLHGICTVPMRNKTESFAHWIAKERMTPEWKTFDVENSDQDRIVLLFDMLYEYRQVFKQQYWMGVITMQNPFDMYSIQDIIYSTRPDLLIETGTANGGSAILWASIMELSGLESSKIITIDVESPVWNPKADHWGGAARGNPLEDKLWKKRVTFIKGDTVAEDVIDRVRVASEGKKTVMVTLDSGHHAVHVAKEMEAYCPLVSVGSYCIVEDTKMSRWHSNGPLEAVRAFLAKHPEFQMDRTRELMYTHHSMGYLKRVS